MSAFLIQIICWMLIHPHYAANNTQLLDPTSTSTTSTSTTSSTVFMTTSDTVSPMFISVLEGLMGNQMELTPYYDDWNMTIIVQYINDTNPTILTDPQQVALVIDLLPKSVIRRMPLWFLMTHGLCDFITPESIEYYDCMGLNITLPPAVLDPYALVDLCVGPLIHSNLWNDFQETNMNGSYPFAECAVSCATGAHVYGITEQGQRTIDLFTVIGCTLCFVLIVFLAYNQYADSKRSGVAFRKAPLLQHLPYCITVSLFVMIFCMFISEVVGKRKILCHKNVTDDELDYEDDRALSSSAPIKGHNVICGVHGLFFYASILFYISYCSLFAFVIFRQMFVPSNPLWRIKKRWWHLLICCIVLPMVVVSSLRSEYEAVWPMGVCLSTAGDTYEMLCVPAIISCVITGVFLIGTVVLMLRQIELFKGVTKGKSVDNMRELSKRLILYGFGIECGSILFVCTAMEFESHSGDVIRAYVDVGMCQVAEAVLSPADWSFALSECSEQEHRMHPFWFISWTLVALFGVAAQTILTCHQRVRNRLQRVVSVPLSKITSQSRKEFDLGMTSKTEQSATTKEPDMSHTTRDRVASLSNETDTAMHSNPSNESQTPKATMNQIP
eukprot:173208_1